MFHRSWDLYVMMKTVQSFLKVFSNIVIGAFALGQDDIHAPFN